MTKAKDPAFLFYSKDFYEGTRTMIPEERACYIDLLIYQHQNGGFIPNDIKRVLMYCSGCNEATLKATLKAKFKQTSNGWVNEVLERVMKDREEFSGKQKINGTVGQFWKKSKAILNAKDYILLREAFENQTNEEVFKKINSIEISEATLKAMLVAMLQAKHKHLAIVIENGNAIEDLNEIEEFNNSENLQKNLIQKAKDFESEFEKFRKAYPGTKGGFEKEFKNFQKQKDWKTEISKLWIALEKEIDWRASRPPDKFKPEWKHLQTWINGRCWEQELESVQMISQKSKTQTQDEAIAKGLQNFLTKEQNKNADIRPMEITATNS